MRLKRSGTPRTPLLERAYELARTGAFVTATQIGDRLKREGYTAIEIQNHLEGKALRQELAKICREMAKPDRTDKFVWKEGDIIIHDKPVEPPPPTPDEIGL